MANNFNRYKAIYDKMVRPNNVSNFPRHVFVPAKLACHVNPYSSSADCARGRLPGVVGIRIFRVREPWQISGRSV